MQSVSSREAGTSRRSRVTCPKCGDVVDLARMRTHLRIVHQVSATELENNVLTARREARRSSRAGRR